MGGGFWSFEGQLGAQICIEKLLASDFEALEVSGAPRGDQESAKTLPKRLQVTIHRPYRQVRSLQEAAGSPQRARAASWKGT